MLGLMRNPGDEIKALFKNYTLIKTADIRGPGVETHTLRLVHKKYSRLELVVIYISVALHIGQ